VAPSQGRTALVHGWNLPRLALLSFRIADDLDRGIDVCLVVESVEADPENAVANGGLYLLGSQRIEDGHAAHEAIIFLAELSVRPSLKVRRIWPAGRRGQ